MMELRVPVTAHELGADLHQHSNVYFLLNYAIACCIARIYEVIQVSSEPLSFLMMNRCWSPVVTVNSRYTHSEIDQVLNRTRQPIPSVLKFLPKYFKLFSLVISHLCHSSLFNSCNMIQIENARCTLLY